MAKLVELHEFVHHNKIGEVNQDETISQEHETRKMKRDQQPLGSQPPVAEPTIAGLTASDGQPNCCERYSD
ncbi:hypothetical protein ACOSQ4_014165 [Xanthoceras sorbifolium]